MNKEVKVKILDMTYDQDNNLFQMYIEELVGDHKKVTLAVSGKDFGITKDIPLEVAQEFCEAMKGKEKNLHIHKVESTISDKSDSIEQMNKAIDDTAGYPIAEIKNYLDSKQKDSNES